MYNFSHQALSLQTTQPEQTESLSQAKVHQNSVLCQHGAARATQEHGQRISPPLSQTQQNGLRCLELGLLPLGINPHQCDKSIVGTKLKSQSCLPMISERTTSLSNYFDLLHFWELPTFAFFIILLLLVHTDFLIALWVM